MLGSQLCKTLFNAGFRLLCYSRTSLHCTDRSKAYELPPGDIFSSHIDYIIDNLAPEAVVNCIGIVKQRREADDAELCIRINSLLPHILANRCESHGIDFYHFSTDCVFSGAKGNYTEDDNPDAFDLYGRSKLLGEPRANTSVTIRTSIIGHEISRNLGLLEWSISQRGRSIRGYKNAIFSGLPTLEVSKIMAQLLSLSRPIPPGLYHLSNHPISKYDLLELISLEYGLDLKIQPDYSNAIDRSLNSEKIQAITGYRPKPWKELINEMRSDRLKCS